MSNNFSTNNPLDFNVNLHSFVGPFDLLLALIKEKKMDILSINMYEITQQYLNYIKKNINNLKIDDVSEYLLIATYLLELKSKKVLPVIDSPEKLNEDIERDKFIQRLLIYKQYQNIIPNLVEKLNSRVKMHENETNNFDNYFDNYSQMENGVPFNNESVFENIDINRIIKAMQKIYLRLKIKKEDNIRIIDVNEISIDDVANDIKCFIEANQINKFTLYDFLNSIHLKKFSKQYFVVAFVAILVLVANFIIRIEQDENDEIYIYKVIEANNEL